MRTLSMPLSEDAELPITQFASTGNKLVVWFPSVATPQEDIESISLAIRDSGIETWYPDFFTAYFLSKVPSSTYKIPAADVKKLLAFIIEQQPGKKIYVLASSRTVIPVFQGLQLWQHEFRQDPLGGVILNSPFFFLETPDPGQDATLFPIVSQTNLPIYILQPALSPRAWQLRSVLPVLNQGGSDVFIRSLKNVRGRFHFRPDATPAEQQTTRQFAILIRQAIGLLDTVNSKPRIPFAISKQPVQISESKKERTLTPYGGDPLPPVLRLANLKDQLIDLTALKGNVVLVNFWTTWCPPCVHEMPSMQQLSERFRDKPFKLLGVNMAEDRQTIEAFLQSKVKVNFPILMDRDGKALLDWKVNAFPTSFLIDKQGKIRYALFGSIDWNTKNVVDTIQQLMNEPLLNP